jgi:hypothetical protein
MTDGLGYCQKMAGAAVYLGNSVSWLSGHHKGMQKCVFVYPPGGPSQVLYNQLMVAPGQCRAVVWLICAW